MTGESKSQTEDWIEAKGAQYAYAYYSGRTLPDFANVSGIPAAILVDPSGKVVWQGHPARLNGRIIEEHLEGALPWPLFDFPSEAKKVAKALEKDDLEDALEEARELAAEGELDVAPRLLEVVEKQIALRVASIDRAYERGDFLTVVERGEELERALGDLPEAERLAALLEKVDDDDFAQDVIALQEQIERIREDVPDMSKKRQAEDAIEDLEKLRDELPDSYAATQAEELIDKLRKLRVKLR